MIHPTAIIYPNVTLGENVEIGAYCVIGAPPEHKAFEGLPGQGVVIGDNTVIKQHVVIGSGAHMKTSIGKNCYIQCGAVISHDCQVGDNVTIAMKAVLCGSVTVFPFANIGTCASVKQNTKVGPGVMLGMGAVATKNLEPWCTYAGVPAKVIGQNVRGLQRSKLFDDEVSVLSLEFYACCKNQP